MPEGHEGALLVWLGITYHCILGLPCKLFGYGVAWTGSRPLRLGIALVLTVGSLLGLVASGLL